MAEGDYIQFGSDPEGRVVFLHQPWLQGTWPPPEAIGLLVGKESEAIHRLVTAPQGETEARAHVEAQGYVFDDLYEVRWY